MAHVNRQEEEEVVQMGDGGGHRGGVRAGTETGARKPAYLAKPVSQKILN